MNKFNFNEDDLNNEFNNGNYKRDNISEDELNQAKKKANKLGNKASAFLDLIALVKDAIAGEYPIDKAILAIFIGAIIYVVSPVDLIPDFIPVLGWLDDVAVIGIILASYQKLIDDWRIWKASR